VASALSPFAIAADLLDPPPNPYLNDPAGYVRDVLGEELWSGQVEMVENVVHHDNTVVMAAHSVGKTRALSRLVLWWVAVHPIGEALVVITSDNDDNIKGGILQEVIAAHEAAQAPGRPFPGKVTLDGKWHAGPNNQTLVAFGRKPSDRNPTGLQGFHRKYLLVIIDECAGVPAELWDAAESLASNAAGKVLAVGNPTDPNSHFAEVCKPGSGWHVQQISAFDTPAYTGEPVSDNSLENLVSPSWVAKRKQMWGALAISLASKACSPRSRVTPSSSPTGSRPPSSGRLRALAGLTLASTSPVTATTSRSSRSARAAGPGSPGPVGSCRRWRPPATSCG
jgi:hypothetical protein